MDVFCTLQGSTRGGLGGSRAAPPAGPSKSAGIGRAAQGKQSWQVLGGEGDKEIPRLAALSLGTAGAFALLQLLWLFW